MASNDIYSMTPGSAVADTLQQILSKQQSDKRQAILDEVGARNVASEISARDDNAATNKANRESQAQTRAEQTTDRANSQARLKDLKIFASQQYPDDPIEANMWRAIEADPERGMPMYQAWMTHKLTNDSKVKPLVPARIIHYGKSNAEPVMEPATPPLMGNQPVMVPQGDPRELLHEAQPNNPASPGAGFPMEVVNDKTGQKSFFIAPSHAAGMQVAPNGWHFTGMRSGTENPNKPPVQLYSQQSVNNLTSAVKANPRTAATAVHAFVGQLTDPGIKWDVQEFLNDPQLKAAGVEAAASAMTPPATDHPPTPEEIQEYRNKFRQVMGIIMATNAVK